MSPSTPLPLKHWSKHFPTMGIAENKHEPSEKHTSRPAKRTKTNAATGNNKSVDPLSHPEIDKAMYLSNPPEGIYISSKAPEVTNIHPPKSSTSGETQSSDSFVTCESIHSLTEHNLMMNAPVSLRSEGTMTTTPSMSEGHKNTVRKRRWRLVIHEAYPGQAKYSRIKKWTSKFPYPRPRRNIPSHMLTIGPVEVHDAEEGDELESVMKATSHQAEGVAQLAPIRLGETFHGPGERVFKVKSGKS